LAHSKTKIQSNKIILSIGKNGIAKYSKIIRLSNLQVTGDYVFKPISFLSNRFVHVSFFVVLVLALFLYFFNTSVYSNWVIKNAFGTIHNSQKYGMLVTDDKGKILYVNAWFLKLVGLDGPIKLKIHYQQLLNNNTKISALLESAMKKKENISHTIEIDGIRLKP